MAVTSTQVNNQLIKWRRDVYREWRRGNLFSPYMGEDSTKIIQVTRELRDGGDIIIVPIVGALRGPGVSTGPLTGNEEKLANYGQKIWVDWSRNAVLLTRAQMRKAVFEQLDLVRPLLTEWQNCLMRDEIVQAFFALPTDSPPANLGNETTGGQRVNGILYENATAQQLNDWQVANADRIVYGAALTNKTAGNHAASLLNVDTTNDKATAATLLLAKRVARRAQPGITPFKDSEEAGREYFVAFCGQNAFRDLAADPAIYNANKDARAREGNGMDKNPIFQDGDLLYRGVIIREIPEIDDFCNLPTAGNGSTQVSPIFLCGQNAITVAWGQMPRPTERKEDDYGMLIGRGVESVYGVAKMFVRKPMDDGWTGTPSYGFTQWGMVTLFVSASDDV